MIGARALRGDRRPPIVARRITSPPGVSGSVYARHPGPRLTQPYPIHRRLGSTEREILTLLEIRPRSMLEVANALMIESPTASHTLLRLSRRGLIVDRPGRPRTWRLA